MKEDGKHVKLGRKSYSPLKNLSYELFIITIASLKVCSVWEAHSLIHIKYDKNS